MIQTYASAGAALAGLIVLILLAGRLARCRPFDPWRRAGRGGTRLHILESLALDPRRRLVLVACDGRAVLLLTGAQDQVVGWVQDPTA